MHNRELSSKRFRTSLILTLTYIVFPPTIFFFFKKILTCARCCFSSYVAFSGKNRILGVAAKNQQVTNMKNTVYNLKRLLGRKFRDPWVQKELQLLPFQVLETANGNIGLKVSSVILC